MADSTKDPDMYDALRRDGASKEKAGAKELGLSGYSDLRKNELIELLREH